MNGFLKKPTHSRSWLQLTMVYFSVTSTGMTGENWLKFLEESGKTVSKDVRVVLASSALRPTDGVTYFIGVIPGTIFNDGGRRLTTVWNFAQTRGFTRPTLEVSLLIRQKFLPQQIISMRFGAIAVLHSPVLDASGKPCLLSVKGDPDDGEDHLDSIGPIRGDWPEEQGFAVLMSAKG
jgi:hypothetical protein